MATQPLRKTLQGRKVHPLLWESVPPSIVLKSENSENLPFTVNRIESLPHHNILTKQDEIILILPKYFLLCYVTAFLAPLIFGN